MGLPADPVLEPAWVETSDVEGLRRIAHDSITHEMFAEFASGNVYRLSGVPRRLYAELLASKHTRAYFRKHFVGRFETERLR